MEFTETLQMQAGDLIEVHWQTVNRDAGTVQFTKGGQRYTTAIETILEKSDPANGYPQA